MLRVLDVMEEADELEEEPSFVLVLAVEAEEDRDFKCSNRAFPSSFEIRNRPGGSVSTNPTLAVN